LKLTPTTRGTRIVFDLLAVCLYRRHEQQKNAVAGAGAMKLSSQTSTGSDVTDTTSRAYERRAIGSASELGYFEPSTGAATNADIWFSQESSSPTSSEHHHNDITSTSSSSSNAGPPPPRCSAADLTPDVEVHQQRLHRHSPLTALNHIYTVDEESGRGRANPGFVGDGVLTDSWRRVSWRARLRAGIAHSTCSSDPGSPLGGSASTRKPSYLSDVIDSVAFFGRNGGGAHARAGGDFVMAEVHGAKRHPSDGGEWTTRNERDCDRPTGHRQSSLVSDVQRPTDHIYHADAYYAYGKHVRPNRNRSIDRHSVEHV